MATLVARPVRTNTDRTYFTTMSFVMLGIVLVGFARTYFLAGIFRAPLPNLLLHIHGGVFTSWMILYVTQNVLVATGNTRIHRKLGWLGAAIATAMVVLGILASTDAVRRHSVPPSFTPAQFIALNYIGIVIFGGMIGLAIRLRRNPAIHKRLMLIATISIMPPAVMRYALYVVHKPLLTPVVMLALLLSVVVYDIATRRKPYYTTLIASVLAFGIVPFAQAFGNAAIFQSIAYWIQSQP